MHFSLEESMVITIFERTCVESITQDSSQLLLRVYAKLVFSYRSTVTCIFQHHLLTTEVMCNLLQA